MYDNCSDRGRATVRVPVPRASLALVLVSGGAVARAGFDAANPANSQFLRVAAGDLVALVGTLSLLGVTAHLLHKFLADSVSAGMETAALEGQVTPDGAEETTAVDDSESTPDTDTDTDAGAVPGADGRAGEAAVEADRNPDTGETSPDPRAAR